MTSVGTTLHATTRLRHWWRPKAGNLLVVLYLVVLIAGLPPVHAWALFLLSVVTILGIGSFGHLLNDLFDLETDRIAGKKNRMAEFTHRQRWGILFLAILTALLPWIWLPSDRFSYCLLIAEFLLLAAYAIPPVRLKDRFGWAVAADAAYAYALPSVLAAYTFFLAGKQDVDALLFGLLFCWQMALGARHYLNHLANDRDNDLRSNTQTLATRMGNSWIHRLGARLVLPAEGIAFAGFLIALGTHHQAAALVSAALWGLLAAFPLVLALARKHTPFSFRFSVLTFDQLYQEWLPYGLLALLCIEHWYYFPLLIAHLVLLRSPYITYFFRRMAPLLRVFLLPLYVFQKKAQPKETTATTSFENLPVIAVVNFNKHKYTETFIWEMIPRLRFRILYLYGDALPLYDHEDGYFLSNSPSLQFLARLIENVFNLGDHYFHRRSIMSYLQTKQVSLIFAQFGPTGVEMLPIATDLGIPLVVQFHGYDVFRKDTVQELLPHYQTLFQKAASIICVSEIMLQRLKEMGAPAEKLFHLPAFVRLDLFPYSDHSALPPSFLAVGRFAETKSPHLTILAFRQVVQEIPEATLTFIGKDGGGELFEACAILVKALNLETHIHFKGVQDHQTVAQEMARRRIFVQHSLTTPVQGDMEGKPVAIMEAMAAGMPIVATQHSGIAELIEHDITGLLVAEYDIDGMAQAMLRLARDHDLARRLGRAASERVRRDPLIAQNLETLENLITECLITNTYNQ